MTVLVVVAGVVFVVRDVPSRRVLAVADLVAVILVLFKVTVLVLAVVVFVVQVVASRIVLAVTDLVL